MEKNYSTKDITQEREGCKVIEDLWVWCDEGDPTKAIYYLEEYIQASKRRLILDLKTPGYMEYHYPNAKIIKVDLAYV